MLAVKELDSEQTVEFYTKIKCNFFQKRKDSLESDNGVVLGSSPPVSGRRRKITESSDSYEDLEKPLDHQRSFSCTKLKQQVEIINFILKHGDKPVYCGKCVGMNRDFFYWMF